MIELNSKNEKIGEITESPVGSFAELHHFYSDGTIKIGYGRIRGNIGKKVYVDYFNEDKFKSDNRWIFGRPRLINKQILDIVLDANMCEALGFKLSDEYNYIKAIFDFNNGYTIEIPLEDNQPCFIKDKSNDYNYVSLQIEPILTVTDLQNVIKFIPNKVKIPDFQRLYKYLKNI